MSDTGSARDILLAIGCGSCGWTVRASQVPVFCGSCGARFDHGQPVTLVFAALSFGLSGEGVGIRLSVAPRVEHRGEWPPGTQEASAREVLRLVET